MRLRSGAQIPPPPPRTNFPLPQELRDQIYGYLLHSESAAVEASEVVKQDYVDCNFGRKYFFETAILAVNSIIGEVAAEYLYTQNTFVLVTVTGPDISRLLNIHDVPIVCKQRFRSIDQYAFSIDIQWPNPAYSKLSSARVTDSPVSNRSIFTMLLPDLASLFNMLRVQCQSIPPDCAYVCSAVGADLVLSSSAMKDNDEPVAPKIEIQRTADRPLLAKHQSEILAAIAVAEGCGHNLSVHGLKDRQKLDETVATLCHKIVWLQSWLWEHFDAVLALKRNADRSFMTGWNVAAIHRYYYAFELADSDSVAQMAWRLVLHGSAEFGSLQLRMCCLFFDIAINLAALHLYLCDDDEADVALTWMRQNITWTDLSGRQQRYYVHISLVQAALRCCTLDRFTDGSKAWLKAWLSYAKMWPSVFHTDIAKADFAAIEQAITECKTEVRRHNTTTRIPLTNLCAGARFDIPA